MNVILVEVGALGTIPKKLEHYVEKGGMEVSAGVLQKVALLGMAGRDTWGSVPRGCCSVE